MSWLKYEPSNISTNAENYFNSRFKMLETHFVLHLDLKTLLNIIRGLSQKFVEKF